jgi:transcriptional regulator with XRE-family HTH domain
MTTSAGPATGRDPSLPVDRHVGRQLRARRLALGLTQQQLARLIGVTYQQLQKYETGANRLTAERLLAVARALDVAVDYFFDRLDGRPPAPEARGLEQLRRLLDTIARRHPELAQGATPALAATAAADPAPAARDGTPGAATARGTAGTRHRSMAGAKRKPAAAALAASRT